MAVYLTVVDVTTKEAQSRLDCMFWLLLPIIFLYTTHIKRGFDFV